MAQEAHREEAGRVVELFAGVGGFRLALEHAGWRTVWANQWEPSTKTQHAFDCYLRQFFDPYGEYLVDDHLHEASSPVAGVAVNEDIEKVLDQIESGVRAPIPDHDLLVGGFPCQDYSVAKVLSQAHGIIGKKGVLWWQILRIVMEKRPRLIFLENVDRLLKSPATQRGRDFAIILACLSDLGYLVEWRVVNAADYGFAQRRRRVFVIAHLVGERVPDWRGATRWLYRDGVLARSLPIEDPTEDGTRDPLNGDSIWVRGTLPELTKRFGRSNGVTPFRKAGVMWRREVWTRDVAADYGGPFETLGDNLLEDGQVPEAFFVPPERVDDWKKLKGAKREPRTAANGHSYFYSEGAVAFPDPTDKPSRTILTGEGGGTPSRFKHVVQAKDGRLRRLTPVELEKLNGFPPDWTEGIPDGRRAFMMGNALVVGLVAQVSAALGRSPATSHQPGSELATVASA